MQLITALLFLQSFLSKGQQAALRSTPIRATENHVGLAVKDLDAEKTWYASLFGMKEIQKLEIPEYHERTVLMRSDNGLSIELVEVAGAARKRSFKDALDAAADLGYGHWAIKVDNLQEAYELLITPAQRQFPRLPPLCRRTPALPM